MATIPMRPSWLSSLSAAQIERVQRQLNEFTNKYLSHVPPLIVDGKVGKHTRDRVVACKWWLGYAGTRNAQVKSRLMWQLAHPTWKVLFPKGWIANGVKRRKLEAEHWAASHNAGTKLGASSFDGVAVGAYFVPILTWCRQHGWKGRLVSGYRTPAYSTHLCVVLCGRSSCPGRCAGASSNHAGLDPNGTPCGAVDVSDYQNFGRIVAGCPIKPRIFNNLPVDPVHFSPRGN